MSDADHDISYEIDTENGNKREFSGIEKEAIEITKNYFLMFEGLSMGGVPPSQDRLELYDFLVTHSKNSKLISSLRWAVNNYDIARAKFHLSMIEFEGKKNNLFKLIGEPKLYEENGNEKRNRRN